jgi:hypothetical protein
VVHTPAAHPRRASKRRGRRPPGGIAHALASAVSASNRSAMLILFSSKARSATRTAASPAAPALTGTASRRFTMPSAAPPAAPHHQPRCPTCQKWPPSGRGPRTFERFTNFVGQRLGIATKVCVPHFHRELSQSPDAELQVRYGSDAPDRRGRPRTGGAHEEAFRELLHSGHVSSWRPTAWLGM